MDQAQAEKPATGKNIHYFEQQTSAFSHREIK